MLLYEIYRDEIKKHGSTAGAIRAGAYIARNDDFIKHAFNFGAGTISDMKRYMKDNARFCVWYDPAKKQQVTTI